MRGKNIETPTKERLEFIHLFWLADGMRDKKTQTKNEEKQKQSFTAFDTHSR